MGPKAMYWRVFSALAVVCALNVPARAIAVRDDVNQSSSAYTTFVATPAFSPVGQSIDYTDSTHTTEVAGQVNSGVLIGSDYVLTAAHTVYDSSTGQIIAGNQYRFDVGGQTYYGTGTIAVAPGWVNGNLNNDLAIVKLSSNVTNVTPANLLNPSISVLGATGFYVGYGYGGNGTTGNNFSTNLIKRAGTNTLDLYGNISNTGTLNGTTNTSLSNNFILSDFDAPPDDTTANVTNETGSGTPTQYEAGITFHDSGGGLFATDGVNYYLVGINEANSPQPNTEIGSYGSINIDTRLASYSGFIAANTPEPGTLGLLGLGAVGFLAGRRRR